MSTAPLPRSLLVMPHAEAGMTVGLFGGSFNPPHAGHALVAETALRRLRLHQLWWMVSPGNPLKDRRALAPLAERATLSRTLVRNPKIKVTGFEAGLGHTYSADVIRTVLARNPGIAFVWIMGADNLKHFHRWEDWQDIVAMIPIAVIDRPGSTLSFLSSPMAIRFARARIDEEDAGLLARHAAPAWTFIHGPRSALSSSAIRAAARSS